MSKYNTIIIGSGIAGMTAAIYLKRANIDVMILDYNAPGGKLLGIDKIENYPGFKEIDGTSLALNIYEQMNSLNIPFFIEKVIDIDIVNDEKVVITKTSKYTCCNVVLAMGRMLKKIGIDNENKYYQKGISYCATCDGNLYRNEDVVLYGNSKEIIDDALYLKNICRNITVISPSGIDLRSTDNITTYDNTKIISLEGKDYLEKVVTDKLGKIDTKALFLDQKMMGNIAFLDKLKQDNNYIIVNEHMETSIKGVYAIGDMIKKDLYQLLTAASDGAIAAISIKKNSVKK